VSCRSEAVYREAVVIPKPVECARHYIGGERETQGKRGE
jgi:hypothetical protein